MAESDAAKTGDRVTRGINTRHAVVGFGAAKPPQDRSFSACWSGFAAPTSGKYRILEGLRPSKLPAEQATT